MYKITGRMQACPQLQRSGKTADALNIAMYVTHHDNANPDVYWEIEMTKRVVSKQTKLLFIGFGAASIATACIVAGTGLNPVRPAGPKHTAIVSPAAATPAAK